MFGSVGFPELILIFVIALIVFGPKRLPEIGRSIGKAMGEFKKATNEMRMTLEEEVRLEELKKIAADSTNLSGSSVPQPNTVAAASPEGTVAVVPAETSQAPIADPDHTETPVVAG